jgi:UDP-GlcNAc:undecaprenyl-phosphate GlcNAc-1-phosphate transferase
MLTLDQVLSPHITVFYAAYCAAFLSTPLMRLIALRLNIVDQPDILRKSHKMPVAYLGGVAIFLGWFAGISISYGRQIVLGEGTEISGAYTTYTGIVLAALIIVLLGLWDDLRGIAPQIKVTGQIGAALCLLAHRIGIDCTRPLLAPLASYLWSFFRIAGHAPGEPGTPWFDKLVLVTSGLLVVLVIVGSCNATNLMDGLDGLCSGVTAIVVAGFLFLAIYLALHGTAESAGADRLRVVISLAMLGALLGFVPFNFNPASIFMGDTGSMLLGFSCGTLMILMAQARGKWFLASCVMFALPILDTSLAFARRWIGRRSLFSADAHHFHHQIMQRGYTVRQTVMICYALAVGFALLGAAMVVVRSRYAVAVYLVTFGSIAVAAVKMGMVHERVRKAASPSGLADTPVDAAAMLATDPESVYEVEGLNEPTIAPA